MSEALPAKDLRTDRSVKLYRWTPEAGTLASSQTPTKEICERTGVEVFSEGKSLWLVEAEVPVAPVLQELRAKRLFVEPDALAGLEPKVSPPAPPPPPLTTIRCATCQTVRDASIAACPTCAGKRRVFRYLLPACITALIAGAMYYYLGLRVAAPAKAPEAHLMADHTQIHDGEKVTLQWWSLGADRVTLDGRIVAPNEQKVVTPSKDETYTLTATNRAGTTQQTVTIGVQQRKVLPKLNPVPPDEKTSSSGPKLPPVSSPSSKEATMPPPEPIEIAVTVDPSVVPACQPALLHWQISGGQQARSVSLQPKFYSRPAAGQRDTLIIRPLASQDYTLTFTLPDGRTLVKTQHVEVMPKKVPGPPACGQIVWSGTIPSDGQVTILWKDGIGRSQAETGAAVSGPIPDYGVNLSATEPWVTVSDQPATLKTDMVRFQSSRTGPQAVHFFWQKVGTN